MLVFIVAVIVQAIVLFVALKIIKTFREERDHLRAQVAIQHGFAAERDRYKKERDDAMRAIDFTIAEQRQRTADAEREQAVIRLKAEAVAKAQRTPVRKRPAPKKRKRSKR